MTLAPDIDQPSQASQNQPLSRRGVAALGSTTVLCQVLIGVAGIVAARGLGPEGRGIVGGVLIWAQTLPYLALAGMNSSVTVRVARAPTSGTGVAMGNALAYSALAGGLFLVPALLVIPSTLGSLGPHAHELAVAALMLIPFGILAELLFAILISLNRIRRYNVCRLTGPVLVFGGTISLLILDEINPSTIVAVTLAGSMATLATLAGGVPWRKLVLNLDDLWRDFVFGLKAAVAGWASLVNLRFDVLLMSTFASASQIGFYGVANNAMLPIATVAAAAAGLLTPSVARLGTDTRAQISMIRREVVRYSRFSLLGAAALAAAAPALIPLLFGPAFGPAVVLVWILIPGYVARVWAGMVTAGAIGMRRPGVGNLIEGASLVVTVALLPFLLPRYEAVGAAVTSTTAYVVAGIAAAWVLRRLRRSEASVAPALPAADTRLAVSGQTLE